MQSNKPDLGALIFNPNDRHLVDALPNITEGLNHLAVLVSDGTIPSASVSLIDSRYQTKPYVQFTKSGVLILAEMISNSFLFTKLTPWEESRILNLGWSAPTESRPNFWREFEASNTRRVAEFLVTSLQLAFDLNPKSWFSFGNTKDEVPLIESGLFWHSTNATHVLCLPGSHVLGTLEGSELMMRS